MAQINILFLIFNCCQSEQYRPVAPVAPLPADTNQVCFSTEIFPIIKNNCATSNCHNEITQASGINLSNYRAIIQDVKPGDGSGSLLYRVTAPNYRPRMPPAPKPLLTEEQRNLIKRWIDEGAKENNNCE